MRTAQLMQLGQAEQFAFSITMTVALGTSTAHLDHGGRQQDLRFIAAKRRHHPFPVPGS